MSRNGNSADSLIKATESRAKFSGHGTAKGAQGFSSEEATSAVLARTGDTEIINPQEHGYEDIRIGLSWDEMLVENKSFPSKLFKKHFYKPVDLDLGCLYELQDGTRGVIQAFGDSYGTYDSAPYIFHSGDERTGESEGDDESILINGKHWPDIKRILLYVYIYDGAPHWASIRPRIFIDVPGEKDMEARLGVADSSCVICAVAGIENVRNGMKITNYTEYFHGHNGMDRAFGFGIRWNDGQKES